MKPNSMIVLPLAIAAMGSCAGTKNQKDAPGIKDYQKPNIIYILANVKRKVIQSITFVFIFSLFLISISCVHDDSGVDEPNGKDSTSDVFPTSDVLELPFVKGGQIMLQWQWLQTGPNIYNFTPLTKKLDSYTGRKVTVQINGNYKPDFLFDSVPYTPENTIWSEPQVKDGKGILMYWHPYYVEQYLNFVNAFADYLQDSPHKLNIVGIRMNWCALGTEQLNVPNSLEPNSQLPYTNPNAWIVPPGVVNTDVHWSETVKEDYQKQVLDTFIDAFVTQDQSPEKITIFARANMEESLLQSQASGKDTGYTYSEYFSDDVLSWLSTVSRQEAPNLHDAEINQRFMDYVKTGNTTGYAESFADSWGYCLQGLIPTYITPPQRNYWRILNDLNMGVTHIAVYGDDLTVAGDGTHMGHNVGETYQDEFTQAFNFGSKYAGYQARPADSPGAWIAFRDSETEIEGTSYDENVNDYSMHMILLNPQNTIALDCRSSGTEVPVIPDKTLSGQYSIGPYDQRFGAWARKVRLNQTINLSLDSQFVQALNNATSEEKAVRVTYLDNAGVNTKFITCFGNQQVETVLSATGQWKTVEIPITSNLSEGTSITITSVDNPITLHMVEVVKDEEPVSQPQGAGIYAIWY